MAPAGNYGAADGATVTVVAQAQAGFALTGTTSFTHTFSATPSCTTRVAPTAPTFVDDTCAGTSPTGASYTIPVTAGVDYLVSGVKTAAGTYPATDGSTVKKSPTRAQAGFSLSGTTSFTHIFSAKPDCTTQQVTAAPPSFSGDDACSGSAPTQASYTVPTATGVDYLVNGVKTPAGTYSAVDGSTVTIAAQAQTGFALTGVTTFVHTFAATPNCLTPAAAAAPSFVEAVCSGFAPTQATYTIPSTTGVDYLVTGVKTAAGTYNAVDGSTVTIAAQAQSGFSLTGTTTFTHTFAAMPICTTPVATVPPTYTESLCTSGATTQPTYTIPAVAGIDYFVNGVKTAAGTYNALGGATVTITAQPEAGFSLTGTMSFTHTFAATPTCVVSVTPAPASFTDAICSGGVASQAVYTIPTVAGVDYFVNGVVTAPGTYTAADGSSLAITAKARPGYALTGTVSFTHTFAATPTCTTTICPRIPAFGQFRLRYAPAPVWAARSPG